VLLLTVSLPFDVLKLQEGVAILLRDSTWKRDTRFPVTKIPKGPQTGWKNGLALHARHVSAGADPSIPSVCFASVHLRWGKQEAQIGLLEAALAAAHAPAAAAAAAAAGDAESTSASVTPVGCPMVLGGDFNVETLRLAPLEPTLASRGLRRLDAPQQDTSLGSCPWVAPPEVVAVEASASEDGSALNIRAGLHAIDHLYVTPDLVFADIEVGGVAAPAATTVVGTLPPKPLGPWGSDTNDGSDHAWAMATLALKAPGTA
jgi:endonuclease/exonuclease/phosphatase family metal-dependent hydrolase